MEHGPELFESAWLKWSWAKAHAQALETQINAWGADPDRDAGVTLGTYYDAKHHRIDVFIHEIDPLPIEWGLLIGDVAHNYRSCLDHIAWALVQRGRTPPASLTAKARSKIYFPIYLHRLEFTNALGSKLPGVRRADIAIVRRDQPYHEGKRRRDRHALAVLHRLSNDDKHRSVQPASVAPQSATYDLQDVRDCRVTRIPQNFVLWETLQVGTQLAPIYVRKNGPNPDLKVHGGLAIQPGLQQGVLLGEWLVVMSILVARLLRELSDPPTELLAKLGGAVPQGSSR